MLYDTHNYSMYAYIMELNSRETEKKGGARLFVKSLTKCPKRGEGEGPCPPLCTPMISMYIYKKVLYKNISLISLDL